jgi:hypothetical protein
MRPGLGAMIHMLRGGSPESPKKYYGRKITKVELKNNELHLSFEDGVTIMLWDAANSCCESRYMRTDDDPQILVGNVLTLIEERDTKDFDDANESHQAVFVEVKAGDSWITIANHVEHNGYYGGFGLSIQEVDIR